MEGYLLIKKINKNYKEEYDKIIIKELKGPELFNEIECISHDFNELNISLNIFNDKSIDKNLINPDNTSKILYPNYKLHDIISENYNGDLLIHFVTLQDYYEYLKKNFELSDDLLYKGLIRKYFPKLKESQIFNLSSGNITLLKKNKLCLDFKLMIQQNQELQLNQSITK